MSAKDRYITVEKGIITMHVENDGHTFLNRGPEAEEHTVSLESLKGTSFYEEAKRLGGK